MIVVIALDLLDFSTDIFSAPFTWLILSYLGLAPLRMVAVVQDLIPATNVFPLMTLVWLYTRFKARSAVPPPATMPRLHE